MASEDLARHSARCLVGSGKGARCWAWSLVRGAAVSPWIRIDVKISALAACQMSASWVWPREKVA
jgi:hypothetical protein